VQSVARQNLPATVNPDAKLLVTPSPLNSILWRVVATSPTHYYEGWYSLFDEEPVIEWTEHDRGPELIAQHSDHPWYRSHPGV